MRSKKIDGMGNVWEMNARVRSTYRRFSVDKEKKTQLNQWHWFNVHLQVDNVKIVYFTLYFYIYVCKFGCQSHTHTNISKIRRANNVWVNDFFFGMIWIDTDLTIEPTEWEPILLIRMINHQSLACRLVGSFE